MIDSQPRPRAQSTIRSPRSAASARSRTHRPDPVVGGRDDEDQANASSFGGASRVVRLNRSSEMACCAGLRAHRGPLRHGETHPTRLFQMLPSSAALAVNRVTPLILVHDPLLLSAFARSPFRDRLVRVASRLAAGDRERIDDQSRGDQRAEFADVASGMNSTARVRGDGRAATPDRFVVAAARLRTPITPVPRRTRPMSMHHHLTPRNGHHPRASARGALPGRI